MQYLFARRLIVTALTLVLPAAAVAAVGPNWIEQYGIRWTFDRPISPTGEPGTYQYGQFITGDYWIVGAVGITSISPPLEEYYQVPPDSGEQGSTYLINGSMVNPKNLAPAPKNSPHGFDQRISGWNQELAVSAPLTLSANSSLISTRGWKLSDPGCPSWAGATSSPRPCIRAAAILTCLDKAPAGPAFRPPYVGDRKPLHYASTMNLSILPDLPPVADTPTYTEAQQWMKRHWQPDMVCGWSGSYLHPSEHMPDYGRDLSVIASDLAALLLLDEESLTEPQYGYPDNWKRDFAIRLIQFGIDSYHICVEGGGWGWVGGGIGQGRKWPILFAGLTLDDASMKGIGATFGSETGHKQFMEDTQKFYITQEDVNRFPLTVTRQNCRVDPDNPTRIYDTEGRDWSVADTGEITPMRSGQPLRDYWCLWDVDGAAEFRRIEKLESGSSTNDIIVCKEEVTPGSGKTVRVMLFPPERIGYPAWGARHAYMPEYDYDSRSYRTCCTANSLAGVHLAALALGAKELWNWNAFFDYMDMYMSEHHTNSLHRQWSSFAANMWDVHRGRYGSIWSDNMASSGGTAPSRVVSLPAEQVFTGDASYLQIPTGNWDFQSMSISMWIRPEDVLTRSYLFGHTVGSWSNRIQLYLQEGALCLGLGDSNTTHVNIAPLGAQQWCHVALTWNSGQYVVYINGRQKASGTYAGLAQLNGFADIGNNGNPDSRTEGFRGTISGVRIYNGELTSQQIWDLAWTDNLKEGQTVNVALPRQDKDGNLIRYTGEVIGLPIRATFDAANLLLSWVPRYDQAGTYEVEFKADAPANFTQKITIEVEDVSLMDWYDIWMQDRNVHAQMDF